LGAPKIRERLPLNLDLPTIAKDGEAAPAAWSYSPVTALLDARARQAEFGG